MSNRLRVCVCVCVCVSLFWVPLPPLCIAPSKNQASFPISLSSRSVRYLFSCDHSNKFLLVPLLKHISRLVDLVFFSFSLLDFDDESKGKKKHKKISQSFARSLSLSLVLVFLVPFCPKNQKTKKYKVFFSEKKSRLSLV